MRSPDNFRSLAIALTLALGLAGFASFVHGFYPIQTWLFWRYSGYLLTATFWLACCLSFGNELMARYCAWLNAEERLSVGMAIGVLSFGLAIFSLGLLHALYPVTSIVLPLVFLLVGAQRLSRDMGRLCRGFSADFRLSVDVRTLPIWLLGVLGVGVLYFSLMSPDGFTFDTRWYHMPMAQRYALTHAVGRFDEGFWMGAFPQLFTYLYTWVFLLPGLSMFDRLELGAHLEFVLFVAILTQIPLVVRQLAPKAPRQLSWCVRLAFPGVYLYDSNLNAGADHVAGFFALPVALAVIAAWPRFEWQKVSLVGVLVSALMLVKYTAWALPASVAIFMLGRGLWLGVIRQKHHVWGAFAVLLGTTLLVTAPHWLKNWIWYGDPIYPQLAGLLNSHPWGPEFAARRSDLDAIRQGAPLNWLGLKQALKATVTFSFIPNDWDLLHGKVPLFGSLFTLTLPCLLFLRRPGKLIVLYSSTMLAMIFWYMLAHYDRYLQTLVPLMAAGTATCFGLIWQMGTLPRIAMSTLISFQVIWGSDVPFIRTHNLIGDSPLRHVAQFIASGFEKKPDRLSLFEPMPSIGKATPSDAVVLVHDSMLILGLDRKWITDLNQSVISYGQFRTPRTIHNNLTALGVTHLVWPANSPSYDSVAGDLAFYGYALRYTQARVQVGGYTVSTLPAVPPPATRTDPLVAYFGCGAAYAKGWYPLSALNRRLSGNPPAGSTGRIADLSEVNAQADFVVIEPNCEGNLTLSDVFQEAPQRRGSRLFVRRTPLM